MIRVDPSWSELIRPGLVIRVDPVRLLYLPICNWNKKSCIIPNKIEQDVAFKIIRGWTYYSERKENFENYNNLLFLMKQTFTSFLL